MNSLALDKIGSLDMPDAIDFEQFLHAFQFLASKPLPIVYQDILDKLYIASKQLNLSIIGFTMIKTHVDGDVNIEEKMLKKHFVSRLKDFVEHSN